MGVPKFYRWISERYPQINQLISDGTLLPEVDSLYLDMNGIIHGASHPNDADPSAHITTKDMMMGIFRYIERQVSEIVKPKKVLFMAIDGVAPRAKMNQQRSRRFRAAQERMEMIEKMNQRRGVEGSLDADAMFDSNCITPGTEFMDIVSTHLQWFIRKKIKEDPVWRDLEIVFSGHDVPGEGEHKIMQFIRDKRASPGYNPNHRHCMVGQDADLIMLALATHEPHFILLREVIDFNANMQRFGSARQTVMRQTKECQYQLLHLSVLREYLELDLSMPIKNARDSPEQAIARIANWTPKNLDRERLIDDFILLTFLVGNDFLPHLPTLDIGEHAFDTIFDAYKTALACHDFDYLVEKGELRNIEQLEKVFSLIGEQEAEILGNRDEDTKEFARRKALRMKKNGARGSKFTDTSLEEAEEAEREAERRYQEALEAAGDVAFSTRFGGSEGVEERKEDSSDDEDGAGTGTALAAQADGEEEDKVGHLYDAMSTTPNAAAKDYRGRYYFEKFKILPKQVISSGFMENLKERYLEGLIWCLAYYTKGCVSWNWYFPFHYGPMLIDMTGLAAVSDRISFDLGQPFRPFQQLLGCLPPLSMKLLPRKYQWLMTADNSPVLEFYPTEFGIDQNGKKNPWEAVVLLPFIDEKMLLDAERLHCPDSTLSPAEKARNTFGKVLYHKFNPSVITTYFSCNAEMGLEDIRSCQSEVIETFPSLAPSLAFKQELIPGTMVPFPGYPSLTILPMASVDIEASKINVFGAPSKYRSITLDIDSESSALSVESTEDVQAMEDKLINLIGKNVFVNYPLLHEAKVVAITTEFAEYRSVKTLPTTESLETYIAECEALYKAKQLANNRKFFSRDLAAMEEQESSVVFPSAVELLKDGAVLRIPHDDDSKVKWLAESEAEADKYAHGRGIPGSGGLQIGNVQARVLVQALQGLRRDPSTGATSKVYGTQEADIPIQLMLLHTAVEDPRFRESSEIPVEKLLPIGSTIVVSSGKYVGHKGTVVGPHGKGKNAGNTDKRVVDVEFIELTPEPPFAYALAESVKDHYYSSKEVCQVLGISPGVLGNIVGNVTVQMVGGDTFDKVNIGLDLKRNGQHQLLGYVRRRVNTAKDGTKTTSVVKNVWANCNSVTLLSAGDGVVAPPVGGRGKPGAKPAAAADREDGEVAYWEYTLRTVALIADYKKIFPEVFQSLARLEHEKCYSARQLFSTSDNPGQRLQDVLAWMKSQPVTTLPRTPFSTEALARDTIKAIERAADVRQSYLVASRSSNTAEKKVVRSMPIELCFRGDSVGPTDAPLTFNSHVKPRLGDRVVNLNSIGVPFGLKGTVVVLHSHTGYVEVLFDEEFVGGKSLNGFCSQFRGKLCPWSGLVRVPQREVSTSSASASSTASTSRAHAHVDTHHGARPVVPVAVVHSGAVSASTAAASAAKSALLKEFVKKPVESKSASGHAKPAADKKAAADALKQKIGAGAGDKNLPTPPVPTGGQVKILTRPAGEESKPKPPVPPGPPPPPMPMPMPVQPNHIPESAASGRGFASLSAAASGNTVAVESDSITAVDAEAEAEDRVGAVPVAGSSGAKVVISQGLAGVDLTTKTDVTVLRGPEVERRVHQNHKPQVLPRPQSKPPSHPSKPHSASAFTAASTSSSVPKEKLAPSTTITTKSTTDAKSSAGGKKSEAAHTTTKAAPAPAAAATTTTAPTTTAATASTKPKKSNLLKNAKKALALKAAATDAGGESVNSPPAAPAALLSVLKGGDSSEGKKITEITPTAAVVAASTPETKKVVEKVVEKPDTSSAAAVPKRIVPTAVLLKKKA